MAEPEPEPEHRAGEWEIVKDLLFQWEDQQPADLDAWLTEHCATASIRREVERLVRAAAASGDFLQQRAVEEHLGIAPQHPVYIGRYRVIEELGTGGLGVVYAAYDQALERKVAIKVLADKTAAGPDRRKRLRWDAKAASAATHPNIVVIYDIGTEAGADYVVMECIEGQSLGKLIPADGLPSQTVLKYALQIAGALEAAHGCGIIHRDLKPNNIMVTEDGVVKLLDFGLAKNEDPSVKYSSLPETIEGHFAGTVAYVSPEQAEGKAVDTRGDIFSFGCILFEMLTGKQAFQGRNAFSVLGSIIARPAPRLRDAAPLLDERFEMIVQRCLCKEPGERFPTMAEVKTRLEELVEPGEAPPRLSYRERRRRRWILSGVAAALAVLLAVGVRIVLQRAFPKTARAERFYAARFTTDAGLSSFPAISLDGRSVAYASDRAGNGNLNLWVQHWGQGDARQITFNPADETSPSFFPSGERLVYRSEQDHGGLYTISSFGGDARLLVPGGRDGRFSRNGRWLAYWKGQVGGAFHRDCAKIYIMPAAGGEPQEFPKGFEAAAYPVWSSTGTQLIFLGRKAGSDTADWWVAGLQDGVARPTGLLEKLSKLGVARPSRSFLLAPADWLPDQTVLFAGRGFDTTNIWAVQVNADGTVPDEPRQWTGGTGIEDYPGAAIASSDGSVRTVFAALTAATAIWRVPLTPDGTAAGPAERLISGFAKLGSPSVSVDGRKLAFSAHQPGGEIVRLADLGSQTHEAPSVMTLDSQASYPVLSGDGSTIAWVSKSTGYVSATQGGAPIEVCHPCGPPSHLTFDGTAALFEGAGASEDLLLVVRGQKPRTLFHTPAGPPWMQSTGHFSPNQHWVAFSAWHEGSEAKQILIVPVTADGLVPAGQIIEVTHDEFVNRAPVWSTDGRRIYFLSNRDSSDCVWARDVDPATARPLGEAFPVAHFHYAAKAIRGPVAYSGSVGLSVARNFLVLTLTETTGSVWVRSNKPRL